MTATTAPVKSLDSLRAGAVEVRVTSNRKRMAALMHATMIRTLINTGQTSAFLIDRQYADRRSPADISPDVTWGRNPTPGCDTAKLWPLIKFVAVKYPHSTR